MKHDLDTIRRNQRAAKAVIKKVVNHPTGATNAVLLLAALAKADGPKGARAIRSMPDDLLLLVASLAQATLAEAILGVVEEGIAASN